MRRFIARQNLQRFEDLLRFETNPAGREQLTRLIEETRTELRYLERIWPWSWPEAGIPDAVGDVLEETLDDLLDRLGADLGSLQGVDRAGAALRLLWHRGFDAETVSRLEKVPANDPSGWASAASDGSPFIVEDVEAGPCPPAARDWARARGIRSIHSLPVTDGRGLTVGIFSAHFRAPRSYGEHEGRLARTAFGTVIALLPRHRAA
ncbi:GAF domain-containing protein [Brevundimonas sp.]|uniref:GAF domain-containing protein n=1 Tax=Brevundimonas sp. TaxID=1871086 RepID=UPI0035B2F786